MEQCSCGAFRKCSILKPLENKIPPMKDSGVSVSLQKGVKRLDTWYSTHRKSNDATSNIMV